MVNLTWPIDPEHAAIEKVANLDILEDNVITGELAPQAALERIDAFIP